MIDDYLTDLDSPEPNILYDESDNLYGYSYNTFNIYNGAVDHPLHKFWFHIPKAKILDIQNKAITIVMPNNNMKIVNFINNFENYVYEYTKKNRTRSISRYKKSFTIKNNFPPTIILSLSNSSAIFDHNDNDINLELINRNNLISIYFELHSVIVSSDDLFFKWHILQLKEIDTIDIKKSFFKKPAVTTHIPPPPPNMPATIPSSTITPTFKYEPKSKPIETSNNNMDSGRVHITQSDILSQLGKLKKVSISNEKNSQKVNDVKFDVNLKKTDFVEKSNIDTNYINHIEPNIVSNVRNHKTMNSQVIDEFNRLYKISLSKLSKIYTEYQTCTPN